jgi:hypothetical protein
VRAVILGQVPDTNTASTIAADDFTLIGMNYYIIDWAAMTVASLNGTASSLPNLDSSIFRACNHPLSFAMESNTSDISCMTFEGEERIGVG